MAECTLFFAGGGTGGHLFPGLAVAHELREINPELKIEFIGSEREIESDLVTREGYPHRQLPVDPLGELRSRPWRFLTRNWQAYRQAKRWIAAERPVALIGLGGFASVPLLLAAHRKRIPTILLEQNVLPGKANRWLSRRADAVCVSFAASVPYFPKQARVEVTGNPVRTKITELCGQNRTASPELPMLLVLGGSQGAVSLNDAVRHFVRNNCALLDGWRLVHQTGIGQADAIRTEYEELGLHAVVQPFFHDMEERYRESSLVITRGGATTLAELACAGVPAVIVPYPHAADNHQLLNAREYAAVGKAKIVEQARGPEESALRLFESLSPLLESAEARFEMRTAMAGLARPDATAQVIKVLEQLAPAIRG